MSFVQVMNRLHVLRDAREVSPDVREAAADAIAAIMTLATCTCAARDRWYAKHELTAEERPQPEPDGCDCSAKYFDGKHTAWCGVNQI